METIFSVRNEHLARLTADRAVDFFRDLLWAEASRIGVGKDLINVPSAITVADGGVDAEVAGVRVEGGQGIIKPGVTRYQIKVGPFSLGQERHLDELLLTRDKKRIHERVRSCLEQGGLFVAVLFGWDGPEVKDDQIVSRCREKLRTFDRRFESARIEVWRPNNLRGFLSIFPSLSLRVSGQDVGRFQSHLSWSGQDDMLKDLKAGEAQDRILRGLRAHLRENDQAVHVRVWGDPGIGKTKLVLEATRVTDLSPAVIYCSGAATFRDSDLMNIIVRDDNQFSAILVIDECDADSRSYIWNKLVHCGPRIKMVTIHHEPESTSGRTVYMQPPPLGEEQVEEIIQGYEIPPDQARRWVDLCGGSPRVAHVIGRNLRNNPGDLLRSPDTVNVWERYVVGGDDPGSAGVAQRRVVLRHVALFRKWGFGRPFREEGRQVARIIEAVDPSVTAGRFQEIVQELRARRILQGETTLYITPKALHVKLWTEWWENYGTDFEFDLFMEQLSSNLREWFLDMFKYAAQSEAAQRVVRELLGPSGPFRRSRLLGTELGGRFFLSLTEADAKQAVRCLESTVGTWTGEQILGFSDGRQYVVWSLERIAVWRDLFTSAARLLLKLAEGENASNSNNSTGIFVQLFSHGHGRVAPTEASPAERFPVLETALRSDSPKRRAIALRACDEALSTGPFTRMLGAEQQGLRQPPELWKPRTYGELYDAYRRVWNLVCSAIETSEGSEREDATRVLLNHVRGLLAVGNLRSMVIDTVRDLKDRQLISRSALLEPVVQALRYEGRDSEDEAREALESLRDELTGSTFESRLERYVGTDFVEDQFNEKGDLVDQKDSEIKSLVEEAIKGPSILEPRLGWLVTQEARDGFRFGAELGRRDELGSLLPMILQAQRGVSEGRSLLFLGGYLRGLSEPNRALIDEQLDRMADDPDTVHWVPELTWRSGMTDERSARRVLRAVESAGIGPGALRMFVYGGYVRQIRESVLVEWIEYLLGQGTRESASAALALCQMYQMRSDRRLPTALVQRLLMHDAWFVKTGTSVPGQNDEYNWSELTKELVERSSDHGVSVANRIVDHFGEDGTIMDGYRSSVADVLTEVTRKAPVEVWSRVVTHLTPPLDERAFHLTQWLRGKLWEDSKPGALTLIPRECIWRWVDEDVDKRAWYLATFVPKDLGSANSLAREVLVRYGDRDDVRDNLRANYATEGWSGPESVHYQRKRDRLIQIKSEESNSHVIQWLDEFVGSLDSQIKRARAEEERRY